MEPDSASFGINGHTGEITDMRALGVWDPLAVKAQTIKTAVESAVRGHSLSGGLGHTIALNVVRASLQREMCALTAPPVRRRRVRACSACC